LLDNLTEYFGKKKKPKSTLTKTFYWPRCDENGQWWNGYEKVYMRRHPPCTFPLFNDKIDSCLEDT
jgi:hypothetical protein